MRAVKKSVKPHKPTRPVSRAARIRQRKRKQMSRESSAHENPAQKLSQVNVALPRWKLFRLRFPILKRPSRKLLITGICFAGAVVALFEIRTSGFEARVLSAFNSKLSYKLGPG